MRKTLKEVHPWHALQHSLPWYLQSHPGFLVFPHDRTLIQGSGVHYMADTAQSCAVKETCSVAPNPISMHLSEEFGFILCVQRKCCKST